MKIEIMSKASVKLLINEALRKQSTEFYNLLNKLKIRISKLEQ